MHSDVSVLHAGVVKEIADDGAGRVDAVGIGRSRAGEVYLGKASRVIQEAAAYAQGVSKTAHHQSHNIHAEGHRTDGSRRPNLGEDPALADEALRCSRSVGKHADNVVVVIDAEGDGVMSAGKIKLLEGVALLHEGVCLSGCVVE